MPSSYDKRRQFLYGLVFFLLVSTQTSAAGAQTPTGADDGRSLAESFFSNVGEAALDRAVSSDVSGFQLDINAGSTTAMLKLGRQVSDRRDDCRHAFSALSFTASVPWDESTDSSTVAKLDGLSDSLRMSVKFSKYVVTGLREPVDEAGYLLPSVEEICRIAGIDVDEEACDTTKVREGLEKAGRSDLYDEFRSQLWHPKAPKWTYGIEGSLGRSRFDFINPANLATTEQHEYPWTAGAYVGIVPAGINALVSFEISRQRTYPSGSVSTVCPPGQGPVVCFMGNLEEPMAREAFVLAVEARTEVGGIGLSLRIAHDLEDGKTGVDLPLFLFRHRKSGFDGGLRLGYATGTDDAPSVGLFLGRSFRVFR